MAQRIRWTAVALLLALSASGPSTFSARAATLPSCAIRLSDLRHGYQLAGAGYSMTDISALQYYVSPVAYDARAALVSYTSSYYLPQPVVYRQVEDSISLYQSSRQAHAAFLQSVALTARWHRTWSFSDRSGRHRVQERWRPVATVGMGDETRAWTTETRDTHHGYSIAFLFFHHGLYLASVRIFGPLHTVSLQQAVPLARLIDRRVQSVCALG